MKVKQKKLLVSLVCLLSLTWLAGSAFATNLVVNGGFELGNNGDFTSGYGYVAEAPNALYPEGLYGIGSNPNNYHSSFVSFGAIEGAKMMIVNGAPAPIFPDPPLKVWAQTVAVQQNTL